MSQLTPTPATIYPFTFTYTTYTTSLIPTIFTPPSTIPSIVPFGPALSCPANSVPTPQGPNAACAISNAREVNDHAFWDLYECCKGKDVTASGTPNPCTAQCVAGDGQTWQELGECLSKRVEVVVCKPAFGEIRDRRGGSANGSWTTGSALGSATLVASASGTGGQALGSTGAGSVVGVEHVRGSKVVVVVMGVLAAGSFAGTVL